MSLPRNAGGAGGDSSRLLLAQYKASLRRRENKSTLQQRGAASASASASATPDRPSRPPSNHTTPAATADRQTRTSAAATPATPTTGPVAGSVQSLQPSALHTHTPYTPSTPQQSPHTSHPASSPTSLDSAPATPATPGGTVTARRSSASRPRVPRASVTQDEINTRWKQIFAEMERWTADEPNTAAAAATPPAAKSAAAAPASSRAPCSYATAAAAQAAFDKATQAYSVQLEGYAIMLDRHQCLTEAAAAQKAAGGPRKGERKLVAPAPMPPPPVAPAPPPLTPYAPSQQLPDDLAWRASLAAHPESLRGDALDHVSLESRLMEYLHRDSSPVTRVKESFVSNFLDAYSVQRNASLRGCTTNQASDLLLSNTLPTLLYFLELLVKLLARLFPELDSDRNQATHESIRQSAMESIFPSIFPTLFALYKRKYFFRDAELAAKIAVLASTGPDGVNIRPADVGVSKFFCLDAAVVEAERKHALHKKKRAEREKRAALGESEAQAVVREAQEDLWMQRNEDEMAQAFDRMQELQAEEEAKAEKDTGQSAEPMDSPPHIPRAKAHQTLQLSPRGTAEPGDSVDSSAPPGHAISGLTRGDDPDPEFVLSAVGSVENGASSATPRTESPSRTTPRHSPSSSHNGLPAASVSPLKTAPSTPKTVRGAITIGGGGASGVGASLLSTSSGARAIPQTRLLAVSSSEFEAKSLSSSPHAEKMQDMFLAMSPARRGASAATSNAQAAASLSKSSRAGSVQPELTQPQTSPVKTSSSRTVSGNAAVVSSPSVPESSFQKVGVVSTSAALGGLSAAMHPTPANGNHSALPAAPSGLALGLSKQRAATSSATSNGGPSKSSKFGFSSNGTLSLSRHSSSDDSDDDDAASTPSMPSMGGTMPALGSSLPMLMGLPSSMLTHTPGQGSELLKKELQKKKSIQMAQAIKDANAAADFSITDTNSSADVNTTADAQDSVHHVHSQQPFVLNSSDVTTVADREPETFPYQEAVVLLRRLSFERTPRAKLACLIAVSQEICYCVDMFYSQPLFARRGYRPSPEDLCINADDLLSIVSFVLIKSKSANLFSEAAFIDDFISRPMKLHMPGYFLATLQASLELIHKIDRSKFLPREHEPEHAKEQHTKSEQEQSARPSYLKADASAAMNTGALSVGALSTSVPRAHPPPSLDSASSSFGLATGSNLPPGLMSSGGAHVQASARAAQVHGSATAALVAMRVGATAHTTSQPRDTATSIAPPAAVAGASSGAAGSASAVAAPAVSSVLSVHPVSGGQYRVAVFPSHPDSRVSAAAATDAQRPNGWNQQFELNNTHFPNNTQQIHAQGTAGTAPTARIPPPNLASARGH